MPYATQNDIQLAAGGAERFLQLADFDADGIVDAEVIARAQSASDAFIDAYLRNRYTPDAIAAFKVAPPPELRDAAAAEAVYWMRSSKQQISDGDTALREARIKTMEQVRGGTLRFDTAARSGGRSVIIESDSGSDDAPMSRDRLRGVLW